MRRPDRIDLQAVAFITVAIVLRFGGAAMAQDCGQAVPTPICLSWAPISGDPSADRCTVAKLDARRLADEYDPARPGTVADEPLPDHDLMLDRLKAAADRVARDCAADAAQLR